MLSKVYNSMAELICGVEDDGGTASDDKNGV